MYQLNVIKHEFLTEQDIEDIIFIKSKQWNFSYAQHLKWLEENIKISDLHLILSLENENFAYLNLIDLNLKVNNINKQGFGVGNVCAVEKGKGFGFELMKRSNDFIKDADKVGLLLCKEPLVNFYKSVDWSLLQENQYNNHFENDNVMIFNIDHSENASIVYTGKTF